MQQIVLLAVVNRFANVWCKYGFTVCKTAAKFLLPVVLKVFRYNPSLQKKSVYISVIWMEIMLIVP
jgi:hypothetical protein